MNNPAENPSQATVLLERVAREFGNGLALALGSLGRLLPGLRIEPERDSRRVLRLTRQRRATAATHGPLRLGQGPTPLGRVVLNLANKPFDLLVVEHHPRTRPQFRLVEHGPVQSVIRVTSSYRSSSMTQDFTLTPDGEQIEVHVVLDWRERHKMLKLRFPVNVEDGQVTNEVAYGHVHTAASGDEMPMQSWVDVSGTSPDAQVRYGVSLLNDSKYSFDVKGCEIGMTVARSPAYAHHVPTAIDPDHVPSYLDQGIQQLTYALLPHTDGWEQAATVRRAAELNQRPLAMFVSPRPDGQLPQTDSFIDVRPANIIVTVLKQAEDGSGLILRAFETSKATTDATIHLAHWGRVIEANFARCEIKTFRVPRDPASSITETDLIEWAT